MKKQILQSLTFILLFSFIFIQISNIFFPKWATEMSRSKTFYEQPVNSIDVLFIGTSTYMRSFSPLNLWNDFGFTSYNRASSVQLPMVTYYYLLESLKYQKPKVVVIDPRWLFFDFNIDKYESWLRFSIDTMKFSNEKAQLINDVVKKSEKQTIISYYFPLFRFHSRWNELKSWDFNRGTYTRYDYLRGYLPLSTTCDCNRLENQMEPTQEIAELNEDAIYYFNKMIELCKAQGIDLVFATTPKLASWDYSKYLAMKEYALEKQVYYIDYNLSELFDLVNLDPQSDFYDPTHLNINGANKVSEHFGKYLVSNFKLANKINNPEYHQWDEDLVHLNSVNMSDNQEDPEKLLIK